MCRKQVLCLKRFITGTFKSSEPLCLLRLNGRVGAMMPSLHGESTDSLIHYCYMSIIVTYLAAYLLLPLPLLPAV